MCLHLTPNVAADCTTNSDDRRYLLSLPRHKNSRNDAATSEDQVWRLQQTGFGAGEVEKGGDARENNLVVTLENLGR